MQIASRRDVEQPIGMTDDRIGQKPAVGKNSQGQTQNRVVARELAHRLGCFGSQAIQKMQGPLPVRQRREHGFHRAQRRGRKGRRQRTELQLVENTRH